MTMTMLKTFLLLAAVTLWIASANATAMDDAAVKRRKQAKNNDRNLVRCILDYYSCFFFILASWLSPIWWVADGVRGVMLFQNHLSIIGPFAHLHFLLFTIFQSWQYYYEPDAPPHYSYDEKPTYDEPDAAHYSYDEESSSKGGSKFGRLYDDDSCRTRVLL